jgi:tetratricopeptide (TPR) repeat protein/transglutaminase-like putative cysteine protease
MLLRQLTKLVPAAFSIALLTFQTGMAFAQTAPAAPLIVKLYSSDIVVDAKGLGTSTIHMEEQATNAASAQHAGQLPITYSQAMTDVTVKEAYTLKADGRKIAVATSAIFTQMPPGASQDPMFDDMRQKTVVFPNVEAGDTIVITYVERTKQPFIPGQYFNEYAFEKTFPYNDARGSITAPKSLALNVEAHDVALEKKDAGQKTIWHWSYSAPTAQPPATGVLSTFDQSPRLIISSLKNYDDFSHAFAPLVASKDTVTDPIKVLAGQITAGVTDRRQQAEKLYTWVSQHIRYVGIEFGAGAIIPHSASTVLSNGYGDCKDHVVLFSALLKAKGIDSEMVLINYGNSYTLPDTVLIGAFNHAITWIPEFKTYADTTAGVAPFGILAFQLYGKPVLHVVAKGLAVHQTPVLPPGVATLNYTTTAHLDDKGNIVGQTKTAASGPLLLILRGFGKTMEAGGADRVSTAFLQRNNIPGTASFVTSPAGAGDGDYSISSTYAIGPYPNLLTGQLVVMPAQFDLLGSLGAELMGPLANRSLKDSDPTPCFSGHETKDATLDPPTGHAFARIPTDQNFNGVHIVYKSHWSRTGQTMTLHRELTTNFDTPLCIGDVRTEAAKAMSIIRDDLDTAVSLGVALSPVQQKLSTDIQAVEVAIQKNDHQKALTLLAALLGSSDLPAALKPLIHAERGLEYSRIGQFDQALAECNAALALDAKNADAFYYRGLAYSGKADTDRAIADYDEAIRLKPDFAAAYDDRGNAYDAKKDSAHAIADYGQAIKLKPDFAGAVYNRAVVETRNKDYDSAISDYSEAIRLFPNYVDALRARASVYGDGKRDYDRALADYNEALRLDPANAGALRDRATIYYGKQDFDRAIADDTQALKINPKDGAAFYGRAIAYAQKKDFDRAIVDYSQAALLTPGNADIFRGRGAAYDARQNHEAALADYNQALKLGAGDPVTLTNRGAVYARNSDFDKAIADYDAALKLQPDNASALLNRGLAYEKRLDYDHAFADFTGALRLRPNDVDALDGLARVYDNKKDFDLAIASADQAIRLKPDNVEARVSRSFANLAKKNYDAVIADCDEALRIRPGYAEAFNNRGNAYALKKDYDRAIADYSHAIQANPNSAPFLHNRGRAYLAKRDFDSAITDISTAIKMAPNEPSAFLDRGNAYRAKKDMDYAITDFSESIRLNPNNFVVFAVRALAYSGQHQYDRAIADDSEALRLNPAFVVALNGRCWSRAALNREIDGALADCNAALNQMPNVPQFLDSRGLVYFRMGKMDLAKADYEAAIAAGADATSLYKLGIVKNRLGDMDAGKLDIADALTKDAHAGDEMSDIGINP